jgi:cytochrome bd ubiquinol oxidase subunit I
MTDFASVVLTPSFLPRLLHVWAASWMIGASLVLSVSAWYLLHRRHLEFARRNLTLALWWFAVLSLLQAAVFGANMAITVTHYQPVKLAAMEGVFETERGAPLHLGGVEVDGELRYAVEIPDGLSLLAHWDPDAEITGLDAVPAADRPPVNVVHLSFQTMVAMGTALLGLAGWFALAWWRRRDLPRSRWFLRAAALSGVAAVVALEAGWVTTEVGRQPWIVYGYMRTSEAVSSAPGLRFGLYALLVVYTLMTVATVYVLRRLAGRPLPVAPQEPDVIREKVT